MCLFGKRWLEPVFFSVENTKENLVIHRHTPKLEFYAHSTDIPVVKTKKKMRRKTKHKKLRTTHAHITPPTLCRTEKWKIFYRCV